MIILNVTIIYFNQKHDKELKHWPELKEYPLMESRTQ